MYIFHLHRNGLADFDEQNAVVVVADDEDHARYLASLRAGDEGDFLWFTSEVTVTLIGEPIGVLQRGLICRDYRAG